MGILVVLLIPLGYLAYRYDLPVMLKNYLASGIHQGIFIALMLVLPVLGAPISVFLILVGMKFGILMGILLSAVLMSLHMAITYYLVHSFLRTWIFHALEFFHVSIPKPGYAVNRWHAFIFMLIPGLPYVVKNNLLALAGIPFASYMVINWVAQFGLSIPFIILGSAVMEMDLTILGIAVGLLLSGYLVQYYVRRKYRHPR